MGNTLLEIVMKTNKKQLKKGVQRPETRLQDLIQFLGGLKSSFNIDWKILPATGAFCQLLQRALFKAFLALWAKKGLFMRVFLHFKTLLCLVVIIETLKKEERNIFFL